MRSNMKASSTNPDPFAPFQDAPPPKEFSQGQAPKEFSGTARSDERFRDFTRASAPVERYGGSPRGSSVQEVVRGAAVEAQRAQFSAIGQLVLVILGKKRAIDFSKHGPMIGLDAEGRLKIPTPVHALPTRTVLRDKRGNTVEDMSQMSPRRRAALMATCKNVKLPQKFEDFAAGRWNGCLVITPLTGMLIHTLNDHGFMVATVQFFPDSTGQWPMLLYNPKTGLFEIVGGGGHVIR